MAFLKLIDFQFDIMLQWFFISKIYSNILLPDMNSIKFACKVETQVIAHQCRIDWKSSVWCWLSFKQKKNAFKQFIY